MPYPNINGGGSGSGRATVIVSGSPFTTYALMDSYSQTHQSELFNNNQTVALAVVTADPDSSKIGTYQWSGADLVYSADGWVFFSGLDAADIKRLYESNPNTNAYTDPNKTTVTSVAGLSAGSIPQSNGAGSVMSSGMTVDMANKVITSTNSMSLPSGGALTMGNFDFSNGGATIIATELASGRKFYPVAYELTSSGSSTAWRENFGAVTVTPAAVGAIETFNSPAIQFAIVNANRGDATQYTFKIPAGAPAVTDCNIQIRAVSHTHNPPLFDYKNATGGVGFTFPANATGSPIDAPIQLPQPAFFQENLTIFVTISGGSGNVQLMGQTVTLPVLGSQTIPYIEVLGQASTVAPIADLSQTIGSVASGGSNVSVNTANRIATVSVTQAQSDWNQTITTAPDFIKNKPTIPTQTSQLTNNSLVSSVSAGHRITVDTTNPRIPVVATPTNTGVVLSAALSINSANSATFEESTVIFNNTTGNLDVNITASGVPTGWAMWVGHFNSSATTATFSVTIAGGTINGAASFTGQKNTSIRIAKTAGTDFTILCQNSTTSSGITYSGTTPANQELIVGTGSASTAQKSGIVLSGGKIPNSAIGVTAITSALQLQMDDETLWNTYKFKRIQFIGGSNSLRGIFTLPNLSAGIRPWLAVGDWVEVQNIGTGGGSYNCQIATANVGQTLSGSLSGTSALIPIATTVYRIQYTGSTANWLVSQGVAGAEGGDTIPYTYWLPQDDGTGIYTGQDVEIRSGVQLQTQPYSVVGSATSINLNTCEFTFTEHVGAAQFFKYLSNDPAFPFVAINQAVPSMDATAALAYLDGTVLNTSYASGVTVQPDGAGILTQIVFVSGTTMQARLVMSDVTNIAIGAQLRIGGAVNSLNNGDFVIQAFTDFGGYTIVNYTNANASVDLNAGDTNYAVAYAAPVLFWRVTQAAQGSAWIARCQFALNTAFSILAEIDPNWFTPGSGHVSWLDNVYQEVVSGMGGNLHTDQDIHAQGTVRAAGGMILAGRNLADTTAPTNLGDSIYYNTTTGTWKVGAPRINQVAVPTSLLPPGSDGKVLTYSSGGISFDFTKVGGFSVPLTSSLGSGDTGSSLVWSGSGWQLSQPYLFGRPMLATTPTGTQVIKYDGVNNRWYPDIERIGQWGYSGAVPTAGQSLVYDSTNQWWYPSNPYLSGVYVNTSATPSDGDVLVYSSSVNQWVNGRNQGAVMSRRQSTAQSIASATDTRVAFDTGDSAQSLNSGNVGLTYDGTTNIGRFTNTSGKRLLLNVSFQVLWQQANGGIRFAWIRWNGNAGNRIGYCGLGAVSGDVTGCNGTGVVGLDPNQYFEVWCYQTSSQTITIGQATGGADAGYGNRIQITRLNP